MRRFLVGALESPPVRLISTTVNEHKGFLEKDHRQCLRINAILHHIDPSSQCFFVQFSVQQLGDFVQNLNQVCKINLLNGELDILSRVCLAELLRSDSFVDIERKVGA